MFIQDITLQKQADILAGYLPNDRLYSSKNTVATNEEGRRVPFTVPAQIGTALDNLDNSNLRKLLNGLAGEFKAFKVLVNAFYDDFSPAQTILLLSEWETALGLPDTIFTNRTDEDIRLLQLAIRLASLNALTKEDFEAIGAAAGLNLTVGPKLTGAGAKETVLLEISSLADPGSLPLTLPFILGDNIANQIVDLFKTLIPAHCALEVSFI